MKKIFKKIKSFFAYVIMLFVYPDKLANAVNEASSPEELDDIIARGMYEGK